MTSTPPIVVGITGASGAPYAVRLLQALTVAHRPISLIVSKYGMRLLATEAGIESMDALRDAVGIDAWASYVEVFSNEDRGAAPASGSAKTSGMIVCPCSMGTMAAIAHGTSRSLIERAADVTLKERRPLVLVPRETPLSLVHLRNMTAATEAGALILPAAPGFYQRPQHIRELVDFIVQRIVDHFGLGIQIMKRWEG